MVIAKEIAMVREELCFYMESQGADVVAYDVAPGYDWDFLFGSDENEGEVRRNNALACERLNNGFWLCHRAFSSRAKMVNGTAYDSRPSWAGLMWLRCAQYYFTSGTRYWPCSGQCRWPGRPSSSRI